MGKQICALVHILRFETVQLVRLRREFRWGALGDPILCHHRPEKAQGKQPMASPCCVPTGGNIRWSFLVVGEILKLVLVERLFSVSPFPRSLGSIGNTARQTTALPR